jgi:hypothetical protein
MTQAMGNDIYTGGGYSRNNSTPMRPFASLFADGYDFTNRFYRRNLGSETRGHYINFYINVPKNHNI